LKQIITKLHTQKYREQSAYMGNLTSLDLTDNQIGDAAMLVIAKSP